MENDANVDTSLKISPELCKEKKEYEIDKELINKDNTSRLANDPIMKNDENFKIKFIEYAPKVFSYLRVIDEVPVKELVDSLLPNSNQQGLKKSEGRSGSFFIVTDDKKFILKTIAVEEAQLLIEQNLLYEMSNFFSEHKTSIISRIYGLFQIKIQTGPFSEDTIYFILMKNVFGNFKDNVLFKYDLKGSQLNRSTKTNLDNLDREVMKDVDFEHIENNTLQLNEKNKNKLVSIIGTDASFLAGQKIMDYSLLVVKLSWNEDEINQLFGKGHKKRTEKEFAEHFGIEQEETDKGEKEEKKEEDVEINMQNIRYDIHQVPNLRKYIYPSLYPGQAYIFAIIDFFQLYTLQKKIETELKAIKTSKEKISSMEPEGYCTRFINYVSKISNGEIVLKKAKTNNSIKEVDESEENDNSQMSGDNVEDKKEDEN